MNLKYTPKPTLKLSIVMPARNEFPNCVHSIYSILHCWEADGFDPSQIEIILVDNGSTDNRHWPQTGTKGTTSYLFPRGIFWSRTLRVIYDPICGNHSARNKGAEIARGEYLFFSDAHMAYKPGFFKYILKAVDETGGIVHGVIGWMGAFPPHQGGLGYQYTMKLGEEIKRTWANYCLQPDNWFYIAAQGHCSVAVKRDQFFNFGGYPKVHRTYGGGEFYLNMKWWMFGSTVAVEPRSIGYHLASGRGYSYNHDDYTHNVMNIGHALGMDDWLEHYGYNCLRKGRKDVLDRMMVEAIKETEKDRLFIEKRRKKSFNEVLKEQTWNKMNDAKYGKHNGAISIFHDTWFSLIKGTPAEQAYRESKHKKDLEKFINENLSQFVYKRNPDNIIKSWEGDKCLI